MYVTSPTDTAAIINAKLGQGLHIVITPGIYQIDSPLVVRNKGQVRDCVWLASTLSSLFFSNLVRNKRKSVVRVLMAICGATLHEAERSIKAPHHSNFSFIFSRLALEVKTVFRLNSTPAKWVHVHFLMPNARLTFVLYT